MFSIEIIVAHSLNRVIGKNGTIPWKLPTDMQNFKSVTLHHPVIMGSKTFLSIPEIFKPLPARINIVLSRMSRDLGNDVFIVNSIEEALGYASERTPDGKIFICGGGEIYKLALPYTHRVHRTLVHILIPQEEEKESVLFPEIENPDEWRIIREKKYPKIDFPQNECTYVYTVAERRTAPKVF